MQGSAIETENSATEADMQGSAIETATEADTYLLLCNKLSLCRQGCQVDAGQRQGKKGGGGGGGGAYDGGAHQGPVGGVNNDHT